MLFAVQGFDMNADIHIPIYTNNDLQIYSNQWTEHSSLDYLPDESGKVIDLEIKGVNHIKIKKPISLPEPIKRVVNTYKWCQREVIDTYFKYKSIDASHQNVLVAHTYHACGSQLSGSLITHGSRSWEAISHYYDSRSDDVKPSGWRFVYYVSEIISYNGRYEADVVKLTYVNDVLKDSKIIRRFAYLISLDDIPDDTLSPDEISFARGALIQAYRPKKGKSVDDLVSLNYDDLYDYYDQNKTNWLEGFSDIISLFKGIKNPAKAAKEFTSSIKKKYYKLFKGAGSDKSFVVRCLEQLADLDMLRKWTLEPLPEDISNTVDGIAAYFSRVDFNSLYEKGSTSHSSIGSYKYKGIDVNVNTKVCSTIYTGNIMRSLLNHLGLDITCEQVWACLPMSFIVDMLYSVSDIMRTSDVASFYESTEFKHNLLGICQTQRSVITYTHGNLYEVTMFHRSFMDKLMYTLPPKVWKCNILGAAESLTEIFI